MKTLIIFLDILVCSFFIMDLVYSAAKSTTKTTTFKYMDLNPCKSFPCQKNGTCHKVNGTAYTCSCVSSISYGKNCENLSPCLTLPCLHGGSCIPTGSNYKCKCISSAYGLNCEYYRDATTNSTIFSLNGMQSLKTLINLQSNQTLKLIYQASRDGFKSFHSKCNGILGTLTVIKAKNSSNIFGGYTGQDWSGISEFKTDFNSFLFSLVNQFNIPVRMPIVIPNIAIFASSNSGPTFGGGMDLYVSSNGSYGYSNLAYAYELPSFLGYKVSVARSFLAGSNFFTPYEIEVYAVLLNPCQNNPCKNKGICRSTATKFSCYCVNKYYGPNCQYLILNSTIFKNSTILTDELSNKLVNLTGISLNYSSWSLIYQASVDSFSANSFHSKCDGINNTLTVIKSKNFVFGGFTSAQWNQYNGYVYDASAFLFSLVNLYNASVKMNIINPMFAIFNDPAYGPTFGNGNDIYIPYLSNISYGYTFIYNYQVPNFVTDKNTFLAGFYQFLTDEIEVYALVTNSPSTSTTTSSTSTISLNLNELSRPYLNYYYGQNNLSQITRIVLTEKGLRTILNGTFSGLTNISYIDLSGNYLVDKLIDKSTFAGLVNLVYLDLNSNQISSIDSGLFKGLSNLKSLLLLNNRLSYIDDTAFIDLVNLNYLYLNMNQLKNISLKAFTYLVSLQTLDISNNQLTSINRSLFWNLTKLNSLYLHDNLLTQIDQFVFKDLINLKILYLANNRLNYINSAALSNLINLAALALFGNQINLTSSSLLQGLFNLNLLYLDKDTFDSTNDLCDINKFSTDLNLYYLNSNNGTFYLYWTQKNCIITTTTTTKTTTLSSLNVLSRSYLNNFYGLNNLSTIKTLILRNKNFKNVSNDAFSGLLNLTDINLSYNFLVSIENTTFNSVINLKYLDLSFNRLLTISSTAFTSLKSLISLSLSNNMLQPLDPRVFNGLINLNFIDLVNNQINPIDSKTFNGLISLQTLYLGGNGLRSIAPKTFSGLSNLTSLYLGANYLESLDGNILNDLINLNWLFLSSASLKSLNTSLFSGLTKLNTVYLYWNQIDNLDPVIFDGLINLQYLFLDFSNCNQKLLSSFCRSDHNTNMYVYYTDNAAVNHLYWTTSVNCTQH